MKTTQRPARMIDVQVLIGSAPPSSPLTVTLRQMRIAMQIKLHIKKTITENARAPAGCS